MADVGYTYGRSDCLLWNVGGIDPRSVSPTPADALSRPPFRQVGVSPNGKTWAIFNGCWTQSPPVPSPASIAFTQENIQQRDAEGQIPAAIMTMPLADNPHTLWDTSQGPSAADGGYISNPTVRAEALHYGNYTYPFWDSSITYNEGDCIVLHNAGTVVARSLRSSNINHNPGIIPTGYAASEYPIQNSDWWEYIPSVFITFTGDIPCSGLGINSFKNTLSNKHQFFFSPRNVWHGAGTETGVRVGADQWASGETQADWIGPVVRGNVNTGDCYFTYSEYNNVLNGSWYDINTDHLYAGNQLTGPEITAQYCRVTLAKIVGGVTTILHQWTDVHGPWCIKLAVVNNSQNQPVLALWSRFWGYDPYERDLDRYPWAFLGTYTDTASNAIQQGQPGFIVFGKPYFDQFVDGETWWGYGELGGELAHDMPVWVEASNTVSTARNLSPGIYYSTQSVTLTANEASTIHYSTDNGVTWQTGINSVVVSIPTTTFLHYYSVPDSGNAVEKTHIANYTIILNPAILGIVSFYKPVVSGSLGLIGNLASSGSFLSVSFSKPVVSGVLSLYSLIAGFIGSVSFLKPVISGSLNLIVGNILINQIRSIDGSIKILRNISGNIVTFKNN